MESRISGSRRFETPDADDFSVDAAALAAAEISLSNFGRELAELLSILGPHGRRLVPTRLDSSGISTVRLMHAALAGLVGIPGLDRFLARMSPETWGHSSFVAAITAKLRPHVDSIELEPPSGSGKDLDIAIVQGDERLPVECKVFENTAKDFLGLHESIFQEFRRQMKGVCNVEIQFDEPMDQARIAQIVAHVRETLPKVTNPGFLRVEPGLKVRAQKPDGLAARRIEIDFPAMAMWGVSNNLDENCLRPLTVLGYRETQLVLSGPVVDMTNPIRNKVNQARLQAPPRGPLLLALDADTLLGRYDDQAAAIQTEFNRERNNVVGAVLLVKYSSSKNVPLKARLVRNAFAKHPLADRWDDLPDLLEKPSNR